MTAGDVLMWAFALMAFSMALLVLFLVGWFIFDAIRGEV